MSMVGIPDIAEFPACIVSFLAPPFNYKVSPHTSYAPEKKRNVKVKEKEMNLDFMSKALYLSLTALKPTKTGFRDYP